MTEPLVVVDADVLGRRRTGDETYVLNLLRALAPLVPGSGLRIAAVTRRPELVPVGIEAVPLGTSVQELRMAVTLPRLLRRLGADLGHFQYALPLAVPCPAIVTIHDLSFEREPSLMGRKDRLIFKASVPRAARKARRVLTVSERTRRDLRELYAIPEAKIVVTPNGVDPVFTPGNNIGGQDYVLFVGAVQERKNPLAALAAAESAGLPLVIVGPAKDEALARELERRGARIAGYVAEDELVELYRGAACLVQPSRFEGFGLPVLEAMACGTPVVAVPEAALQEVAGDAAVWAGEDELGDRDPPRRRRSRAPRRGRARAGTPLLVARDRPAHARGLPGGTGPVKVSAIVVSHGHAAELERSLPALASQVDDLLVIANVPGSVGAVPEGVRVLENERRLSFAANVNVGITATTGEYVLVANPDAYPGGGCDRRARPVRRRSSEGRARRAAGALARRDLAAEPPPVPDGARHDLAAHTAAAAAPTRTTIRSPTTARDRQSPCRATGCSAALAC